MKRSLLLLLLLPVVTQAQSRPRARTTPRAPAPATRCTDSLTGARWRITTLSVAITEPAPGDRDRDRYTQEVLRKLVPGYRDPNAALIPAEGGAIVPPLEQRAAVGAGMELVLDKDGKVITARITRTSGNAALDSAFVVAARSAERGRGYGRPPRGLRADTVRLTLAIADRDLPPGAVSLGGVASSYLEADVPPRIRSMPPARAPRGRRGREVVLAGTVDRTGQVIASTIRVVSTNDSTLIPVARRSMEHTIFYPGTFHGCPAESPIRFPFKF